uniref:Uncharacterized protein n=1 Tax=Anolis carolinensis TaxID=28377 RepID=A0A803TF21_ANOCA
MSAQEGKGSLRKSKHMTWRSMEGGDMHFILNALEDVLKRLAFKKVELRRRKKPFPGQKQKKEQHCANTGELQDENESKEVQLHGWTSEEIRNQLAIGINEVTRALEKNELLLVLVCKSIVPGWR